MAKNITKEELACFYNSPSGQAIASDENNTYEGSFVGDLTGNADTATALKNNWQLNLVGDVDGSAVLNNKDTNLNVTVKNAQHATKADNAEQTQECAHASLADLANKATFAEKSQTSINSEYATEAEHATTADEASHALNSDRSVLADNATNAVNAESAQHATTADSASYATKADEATYATNAGNATNAENATKAKQDFYGNQIDSTYMTVVNGATKDELLKTILVAGKASGSGTVEGTSVTINIDSIVGGGGEGGSSTKFVFVSDLPSTPDINNVYVNADSGKLWIYDTEGSGWHDVLVKITGDITALNQSIASVSASIDTKISASETNVLGQVDVKINSAKSEVITTSKNYTDAQISTAKVEVNTYTDNSVNNAKTSLNETITNKTESAKNEANSYTDNLVNSAKTELEENITTSTENAKTEANSYTDAQISTADTKISELSAKINDIEQNLSGSLPVGSFVFFAGTDSTIPNGFLICNGAIISRTDYSALFDCIGTTWGDGDGETTFTLPDLTGRFLQGFGLDEGADNTDRYVEAGLPDATGSLYTEGLTPSGAFYTQNKNSSVTSFVDTKYTYSYTNFSLSRSNAIFGKSTTVQPPSAKSLILIKY